MLKKLLKLFEPSSDGDYRIIKEDRHQIPREDISRNALKVIRQLRDADYSAYLVGGGVRDLLLNNHPKDFDVATDATPEEIRAVFKNSRIIGKRFQIVHVRFGREIIEVTTFRANHDSANKTNQAVQSDHGILLRDNVYGDISSDAARRDFTVNALYYDPDSGDILDFTSGIEDLESRIIRMIGDPETRYKEDPVRLLRAIRFASKLGFSIEGETETPIREHADYLSHIPAARLFEEVLKLFMSGYATATLHMLRDYGLLQYLFPGTEECLEQGDDFDLKFISQATLNTDKRIRQNKHVTPAFLYAAFLWPAVRSNIQHFVDREKLSPYEALQKAAQKVISQQLSFTSIPKRFLIPMREIWTLQFRLSRRDGRRAYALMQHQRFRAAYDFLLLREEAGEDLNGLGAWWSKFQDASAEDRESMIQALKPQGRRRPRRRRSNSKSSGE